MQSIRHYILTYSPATIGGHTPIVAQDHIESMDLDALYQQIDEAISHSAEYVGTGTADRPGPQEFPDRAIRRRDWNRRDNSSAS